MAKKNPIPPEVRACGLLKLCRDTHEIMVAYSWDQYCVSWDFPWWPKYALPVSLNHASQQQHIPRPSVLQQIVKPLHCSQSHWQHQLRGKQLQCCSPDSCQIFVETIQAVELHVNLQCFIPPPLIPCLLLSKDVVATAATALSTSWAGHGPIDNRTDLGAEMKHQVCSHT